jgi:Mrp family chromosome partitioning ATPase
VRPAPRVPTGAAAGLVARETEYARLSREVAEERERVQRLDSRQFAANIAASAVADGAARVTVVDPAYLPTRPVGMRPKLLMLGGSAIALLLGLATCAAFAWIDDRVRDRGDLERLKLAPLLTEVPWDAAGARGDAGSADTPARRVRRRHVLRGAIGDRLALPASTDGGAAHASGGPHGSALAIATRAGDGSGDGGGEASGLLEAGEEAARAELGDLLDPRLVLLRAPSSAGAASFRLLRHRVLERGGDPPAVILVTSASADEGKTTCALNLALALSEGGRAKVLLLDANFRRPAVTRVLGLLDCRSSEPWVTVEQLTPFLHVALDSQPDALDGHGMTGRIERLLEDGYDFLVIDGPPVLGSADVNVLQESATSVVLTAWAGRSHGTTVRQAVEQIGAAKVAGIVLMVA